MNIQEALRLTNTKNKAQLGRSINMTPQAVYQWNEEKIPTSAELAIIRKAGLIPPK